MMRIEVTREGQTLAKEITSLTGENVNLCYQCRRCTLGCPTAYEMSLKPHEMMRALQFGLEEEVFHSGMIWMCVSCEACSTRCPQDIDILRVIDCLRELVMSERVICYNPHPEVPSMHRFFLTLVNRYGRVYETALAFVMNLKMVDPFKDIDLVWPMVTKGRLTGPPPKSGGLKGFRQMLSRIRKIEGEN
jgi:heterodisulfide reductase subunit C